MDKWTRVDESLPDGARDLLICTPSPTPLIPALIYIGTRSDKWKENGEISFLKMEDHAVDTNATHWMYLPYVPEDIEFNQEEIA